MRSIFLVAYDVADDKRRTRVHGKLKGFGESLQYSVFRCTLTPSQRLHLRSALWTLIDHSADRVLLIDLGPDDGRGRTAIESWGQPLEDPAGGDGPLIV